MATTTIVITYTAQTPGKDVVTSATVDGAAYNALTGAQVNDTLYRLASLEARIRRDIGDPPGVGPLSDAGKTKGKSGFSKG